MSKTFSSIFLREDRVKKLFVAFSFILLMTSFYADVKSTNGVIHFDVQSDGSKEMTLNETGLGINITPTSNLHVNGNAVISETLSIGTTSTTSNLNVSGTLGMSYQTVTSDTTLEESSVVLVDTSNGNINLSLPYAANVSGRTYMIKKTQLDQFVWLDGGGNLIDSDYRVKLPESSMASLRVVSDGENWSILDKFNTEDVVAGGNLVGWWKLDESSGVKATDSSGFRNVGTFLGSADFSTNVTSGNIGQAITLDGVDDEIEISDSDTHTFGDGTTDTPFSISLWVYPLNAAASSKAIISKAIDYNNGEYYILIHGNDIFIRLVDESASAYLGINTTDTIFNDDWYHIVVTYDGSGSTGGLQIYMNGQAQATSDSVSGGYVAMENTTKDLSIGLRSSYFEGYVDDVRLYSKTLSASEVLELLAEGQ